MMEVRTSAAVMPKAATVFVDFSQRLRAAGFIVSSDQTRAFIEAVGLLGPRNMRDIYRAARATLAPSIDRVDEFDAVFRHVFFGQSLAASASADSDEDVPVFDAQDGQQDPPKAEDVNDVGGQASATEALSARQFPHQDDAMALRRLQREASQRLPRRKTLRHRRSHRGERWDRQRSLRLAARRDGELFELPRLTRSIGQRRLLLLIDVSGSMKEETDKNLRFAHALTRAAHSVESFTLGTRLTRVTRALSVREADGALAAASQLVADFDGGTRLGDALLAFLSVPKFAGFARGALVLVVSDGLERGEPDAMASSMARLSRLAWHIAWLSPLLADPRYSPDTKALQAALPFIDEFVDGSSVDALTRYVLNVREHDRFRHVAASGPRPRVVHRT